MAPKTTAAKKGKGAASSSTAAAAASDASAAVPIPPPTAGKSLRAHFRFFVYLEWKAYSRARLSSSVFTFWC